MDRGDGDFTEEQLAEAKWAQAFPWNTRSIPETFDPVQLESPPSCHWCDWWNPRTLLCCCLYPICRCLTCHRLIDADDADIWKSQLEATKDDTSNGVPEPLKGLWWLKYNYAPEELVVLSDATFTGTFNQEGTDGYGKWTHTWQYNWTKENACFGHILACFGNCPCFIKVVGRVNLKDGIMTVHALGKEGTQVVYRVNENEWWKIHYNADPGEEGDKDIHFMYKWIKVLDKNGNKTEHWAEWEEWVNKPTPHANCGTPWFPCWSCCLKPRQVAEVMILPNKKQAVRFKHK